MCKEYRDCHLYKQLTYLYSLFDIDKQKEVINAVEKGKLFFLLKKTFFFVFL